MRDDETLRNQELKEGSLITNVRPLVLIKFSPQLQVFELTEIQVPKYKRNDYDCFGPG